MLYILPQISAFDNCIIIPLGARAGLGPSPGWGPVRVGAHMGPYGSSWTGLGRLRKLSVRLLDQFRTFRVQKLYFYEIINDSASFLPEKLNNHVILTKNPDI